MGVPIKSYQQGGRYVIVSSSHQWQGFENRQAFLGAIPNLTILLQVLLPLNQGMKCFQGHELVKDDLLLAVSSDRYRNLDEDCWENIVHNCPL